MGIGEVILAICSIGFSPVEKARREERIHKSPLFSNDAIKNLKKEKEAKLSELVVVFDKRLEELKTKKITRWNFIGYPHIGDKGIDAITEVLNKKKDDSDYCSVKSFAIGNNSIFLTDFCKKNSLKELESDLKKENYDITKESVGFCDIGKQTFEQINLNTASVLYDKMEDIATKMVKNITVSELKIDPQYYKEDLIIDQYSHHNIWYQELKREKQYYQDTSIISCFNDLAKLNADYQDKLFIKNPESILKLIEALQSRDDIEEITFRDEIFKEKQNGKELFFDKVIKNSKLIKSLRVNNNILELVCDNSLSNHLLESFKEIFSTQKNNTQISQPTRKDVKICFEWNGVVKDEEIKNKFGSIIKGNSKLLSLDISKNTLSYDIKSIADGLKDNIVIESLYLSNCGINNENLNALLSSLEIRKEDEDNNKYNWSDESLRSNHEKSSILKCLDLSGNKGITNNSFSNVKKFLENNIYITEINLEGTEIFVGNQTAIKNILQSRKDLYKAIESQDRLELKYALFSVIPTLTANTDSSNGLTKEQIIDKLFKHLTEIADSKGNRVMLSALPKFKEIILEKAFKEFTFSNDILSVSEICSKISNNSNQQKTIDRINELEAKIGKKINEKFELGSWQNEMLFKNGKTRNKFEQYQHFKEKIATYGKITKPDGSVVENISDDFKDGFKKGDELEIEFTDNNVEYKLKQNR